MVEAGVRIAHVVVDVSLPHLDRVFDYAIPDAVAADARPGVRVRVRFAGRLQDGWIVGVDDSTTVPDKLAPLDRVVSPEVVLPPALLRLARAVADRWGGVLPDVLRLAIPPRHGATERAVPRERPALRLEGTPTVLPGVPHGAEFLAALGAGRPVRAVWNPVPVHDRLGWADGVLEAAAATLSSGRDAVVVVPDAAALAWLSGRAQERFGPGTFVQLTADVGPAPRYRAYLAAVRGTGGLVLGTRSAVFAPVRDLGLVVVWDEGNDLYAEPRAPYPHTRDVAALRAQQEGAGLLLGGFARSAEAQALVERGWLVGLAPSAAVARRAGPAVRVAVDCDRVIDRDPDARAARLPHPVFEAIRAGLASGPVLISVPLAGYVAGVACQGCRMPAACPHCRRPLSGQAGPDGLELACPVCGPLERPWRCPGCGDRRLRAPRIGIARTAEELGLAFPSVRVVQSWSGHPVANVPDAPALVLATPGTEPDAEQGYAAAVLLDAGVSLGRPDLRAAEESLRRWLSVTARVRPGDQGGTVTVVGDSGSRVVQALVRLDPVGFAEREFADRVSAGFPPAGRLVVVEGDQEAVAAYAEAMAAVTGVEVVPPSPAARPDEYRVLARTPLDRGPALLGGVRTLRSLRSAKKEGGAVRVLVDPYEVG